jgi:hypothetical protein
MARNANKPRLDQYRVGSLLRFDSGDGFAGHYLILRIERLKKSKTLYAVHMWKLGTPEPKDIYDTHWQGAHNVNKMMDQGIMRVESY